MLDLFPDSAEIEHGELAVGGVRASEIADRFGTPLVVYCEQTLRAQARAYVEAAAGTEVLYSVKAFPSVEVIRVLAGEGLGAEVSTLGELAYARSEERRVGKECRSRWSPYQEKRKKEIDEESMIG